MGKTNGKSCNSVVMNSVLNPLFMDSNMDTMNGDKSGSISNSISDSNEINVNLHNSIDVDETIEAEGPVVFEISYLGRGYS